VFGSAIIWTVSFDNILKWSFWGICPGQLIWLCPSALRATMHIYRWIYVSSRFVIHKLGIYFRAIWWVLWGNHILV